MARISVEIYVLNCGHVVLFFIELFCFLLVSRFSLGSKQYLFSLDKAISSEHICGFESVVSFLLPRNKQFLSYILFELPLDWEVRAYLAFSFKKLLIRSTKRVRFLFIFLFKKTIVICHSYLVRNK